MALYKRARRQSGERLRPDAADDAGPARVLRDAARRRSSCGARRSSAGFTTSSLPRSVSTCSPVLMGLTQFWQQWITPADRRRSGAAEDDDGHAGGDCTFMFITAARSAR